MAVLNFVTFFLKKTYIKTSKWYLKATTYICTTHDCQSNGYDHDHQGTNSHPCLAKVAEVDEFLPLFDRAHQEEGATKKIEDIASQPLAGSNNLIICNMKTFKNKSSEKSLNKGNRVIRTPTKRMEISC